MKYLIALLCCLPIYLLGQPLQLGWENTYGGRNADQFYDVFEASNGYVFAVGETASDTKGGTDGLLVITDFQTGQLVARKTYGGKKNDVLRGVAQTPDGFFLLAGATESTGFGKSDGWMVKVNEKGEVVWEKTWGTGGGDEFHYIVCLPDGAAVTAGYMDDRRSGDVWLLQVNGQETGWEKQLGKGNYENVRGLVRAHDGGLVLTGGTANSSQRRTGDIWLVKTSPKGEKLWEQFFGEKDWEEVLDITATRDRGFALAGLTRSKGAGDLDMWLIKTAADGVLQWDKTFGDKDADLANAVAQTEDNGFILAGATKSHRSGARNFKMRVVRTDAGGARQWERDFGEEKDDIANAAVALHDGTVAIAGKTASKGEGADDAWLLRLSNPYESPTSLQDFKGLSNVQVSEAKLAKTDAVLKPNEQTWMTVTVTNNNDFALADVQLRAEKDINAEGLEVWNRNYIGHLGPRESKEVRVPVRTSGNLATGNQTVAFELTSGAKSLQTNKTTLVAKAPVPATLRIANFDFKGATNRSAGQNHSLEVIIENAGDFPSRSVTVAFELPPALEPVAGAQNTLGEISPQGKKAAGLSFRAKNIDNSYAQITCVVKENGQEKLRENFSINPATLDVRSGSLSVRANKSSDVYLLWTDPDPSEVSIENLNKTDPYIDVKLKAVSAGTLRPQDFKIYVNSVAVEGSKFDEEELTPGVKEKENFTHTYKNRLPLVRGENRITIEVTTPEGKRRSETLVVRYEPKLPNLHILAIGPQHEDLRYTNKDAADFAAAFRNQEGKLFDKVFVRQMTDKQNTTRNSIEEAMIDLNYKHRDSEAADKISEKDVLLVFISSHGKTSTGKFKLLPSDYDPRYESTRTVDYQQDILDQLNAINCKKVMLIDACHSGSAYAVAGSRSNTDKQLSEALTKLIATQPGLSTLTSCHNNELSYEDENWENGAFTEAILEAFNNKSVTDEQGLNRPDADGDNVVTLGELYQYLQRRVPQLVKERKPNAPTTQVPFMPETQLNKEMPLFFLGQ